MTLGGKIFLILCFLFLFLRIYYSNKLENRKRRRISIIARIIGGVYSSFVIFPILKSGNNIWERKMIRNANIATLLFWIFFLLAVFSSFI